MADQVNLFGVAAIVFAALVGLALVIWAVGRS